MRVLGTRRDMRKESKKKETDDADVKAETQIWV